MGLKEDASQVLRVIAEHEVAPNDPKRGRHNLTGEGVRDGLDFQQKYAMTPDRINDAVKLLENTGYVQVNHYLGTAPYAFGGVELLPSGRLAYEDSVSKRNDAKGVAQRQALPPSGDRIFLGHGRSPLWRELKDFLADRLGLKWDEFNREATAGLTTVQRLEEMLDSAIFAFLILTAEDELANGAKAARANVVHEVGLFQGRLGFRRAIVLLEEGCEEFSNITGLTQIRFPAGNVAAVFEEIRRVLEREGIR